MPELCIVVAPLGKEGAGNAGATNAPAALRAMKKARKQVTTGTPKRSGIPCTMVLRLIRALLGVPGLIASVARGIVHELDPSVGRSGPRDFAIRGQRHSSVDVTLVHRIPLPTLVTIAKRPSCGCGTREGRPLICPTAQAKYFRGRD